MDPPSSRQLLPLLHPGRGMPVLCSSFLVGIFSSQNPRPYTAAPSAATNPTQRSSFRLSVERGSVSERGSDFCRLRKGTDTLHLAINRKTLSPDPHGFPPSIFVAWTPD
ncbi:predicted protein [Histoplasma capsulatum var. duboisii H88]|uniref:Predicted protein n=1 Tax=Ajellomyces capsulatus (strain H88) TaxID=544711 RepID=F0UFY7_AJEC8|nr:predicted protein [Histoplasma capsulatum var. duboisii H88]